MLFNNRKGDKVDIKDIDYWRKKADKNLKDAIIHRINSIKGSKMYQTDGYIIYTIGVDTKDTHLNGGLCLDDDYAGEMVEKAEEFFGELGFKYSFWVRGHGNENLEKILKDKGYKPSREPGSAGMMIQENIKYVELPEGYEMREVKDEKEILDFASITKEAFEKEDSVVNCMFSSREVLVDSNVKSFLIYKGDLAVSAAITMLSSDVAGIYYVGTLESERGKGLGSYIVRISTNKGLEEGKKAVILQASKLGESVYKKLGYKTITRYRTYRIG